MRRPFLPVALTLLAVLVLAASLCPSGTARAEDEAPAVRAKLEKHPLADAKPGEYLRYVQATGTWKKYFIERIIEVKDGKVYWTIHQTNQEGAKDLSVVYAAWLEIPEFKASEEQRIEKDEMVELEVNGQKLWCRHLQISEPKVPGFPEPRRERDVWYTNDLPCGGKVKESTSGRMVLDWGMMPPEELKRRQDALHAAEAGGDGESGS